MAGSKNLYVEMIPEAGDVPKNRLDLAGERAMERIRETFLQVPPITIDNLIDLLKREIIEREYTREVVQFQKEKIIKLQQ